MDLRDIQEAAERIRPYVHRTPLIHSNSFSSLTGADIYLKAENLQKTGSFKVRGAFNRIFSVTHDHVIAASMGNHAQAVAYAARLLGKRATIVMPVTAPIVKEEATRGYGAEVILHGNSFSEALDYALSRKDAEFIHAFDDDRVIAGQGTIGLEVLEDLADAGTVLVPVGGGGLIAGIAASVKKLSPRVRVIGVQADAAQSAFCSFREKRVSAMQPEPTIADGIAVGRVGEKTIGMIREHVDDIVLVDEDAVAQAILLFLERKKLVVEGAGAVTLAAAVKMSDTLRGTKVVLVVSGGNIDFTIIDRIIHKGLLTSGRIGIFEVTVDDIPGSLHSLTGIISAQRANILNVVHDRLSVDLSLGTTKVIITVEVRKKGHLDDLLAVLGDRGFSVRKRDGM